jgi:predicted esterase
VQRLNNGLYHVGPSLDHGPLPSLFYFAISAEDSLTLDPFNQPVQFLARHMIRIFSMTLPGHENGLPATSAMQLWAEDLSKGNDCVSSFLAQAERAVNFAVDEKFIDPNKMAVAGLSRGAFIACHLAARDPRFRTILGFAPLTRLSKIKEFASLAHNPLVNELDLIHLADTLSDRHLRLYIGNHDTRVGTRECFNFLEQIVEKKKKRVADAELIIGPSMGRDGHGTSPEIFKQGATWLATHLTKYTTPGQVS